MIVEVPVLKEYDFGQLEGKNVTELQQDEQHNEWINNPVALSGIFPQESESFVDFLKRINIGVKRIPNYEGQNTLVVSHAMVTRTIRFLGLLSSRGVQILDQETLLEHGTDFFYSNLEKQKGGFIKIPHSAFKIDSDSLGFLSI